MSLGFPSELTDTERGLMTVGGVRTSDISIPIQEDRKQQRKQNHRVQEPIYYWTSKRPEGYSQRG